jgi:hypothetical protein
MAIKKQPYNSVSKKISNSIKNANTVAKSSSRMMKTDKYGLTKTEKMIKFYREHPVIAMKDILGIELLWFQRIQLRELWSKPYCCMKWGRGTSKSSLVAMYVVLKAMLYPNSSIGVIAPSFRQTGFIFDYIDELYMKSAFFRSATSGHVQRTTERSVVKFHNGSMIEGLPIGNDGSKIRGRRYSIAILDEYSYHNEETIKLVVRPFLTVQKGYKVNQLVICSTPSYRTNHFYDQYLRYKKLSLAKPELYSCTSYNFIDVVMADHNEFRIDLNFVYEQFSDSTLDEFMMEYGGFFPSEGSSFFSPSLISKCEPRVPKPIEMEFFGDPDFDYVMGIDPARSEDGDNFAITIMKLLQDQKRHVVRVVTTKGTSFPELADLVREQMFVRGFATSKICMDYGGGGGAIADLLAQPWWKDGNLFPAIVTEDQIIDKENYDHDKLLPILELIHFNIPMIDYMYNTLKADMEHRNVLFPLTIRRDPDPNIQEHGIEFALLKSEMQHLTPKPTTRGLTFEENPRLGKDRITSCTLANLAANILYKKAVGLMISEPSRVVPVGFWT